MAPDTTLTTDFALGLDPDELAAGASPDDHAPAANDGGPYRRLGFGQLSDEAFFDVVARVVSVPKHQPASSFILHAPLELLARRALLRTQVFALAPANQSSRNLSQAAVHRQAKNVPWFQQQQ